MSRTAICLDCRTVLHEGEACDGGPGHRVTSLRHATGRERLLEEVWGSEPARRRAIARHQRRMTVVMTAMGAGIAVGALVCVLIMSLLDAPTSILLVPAVLFPFFIILVDDLARHRASLLPAGARHLPAPSRRRVALPGRIVSGETIPAPVTSRPCVGYGLALVRTRARAGAVMLHDAATGGFDVKLDDGRTVRVPAGRLCLEAPLPRVSDAPGEGLDGYLKALDPTRAPGDLLDPFAHDLAFEARLRPGDRVEVLAALEVVPDVRAPPTGYRQAAATVLVPDGVPTIRCV